MPNLAGADLPAGERSFALQDYGQLKRFQMRRILDAAAAGGEVVASDEVAAHGVRLPEADFQGMVEMQGRTAIPVVEPVGDIAELLDLAQRNALADGVDRAGGDEESVAWGGV